MNATWKEILKKFFDKQIVDRDSLNGILITGSYAKNIQHPGSDIDVVLISKSKSKIRKRGNIIVDGVMVEYYVNTYQQILKYFEVDKEHYNPMIYFSILEGKIVFEKYGILSRLKKMAKLWMDKQFPSVKNTSVEFAKYVISDTLNKMESLYRKRSDSFTFSYFINLKNMYESYAKYLRQPILKEYMLTDYFSKNNRLSELINKFPDDTFSHLFYKALTCTKIDEQMKLYKKVSDQVLERMGGFEMNGWSLTLPVDYSNRRDVRSRVF